MPVKEWWVRGSKNHNKPRIEFGVWFSNHKSPLPHSSAADTMLCVHNPWICAKSCESPQWVRLWNATLSECAGYRAKKASVHRSSTSNKVTGRQSLSSSTKLIPGNIVTRAASTKVPAQVGCTWCSPVAAEIGKRSSSVFSL